MLNYSQAFNEAFFSFRSLSYPHMICYLLIKQRKCQDNGVRCLIWKSRMKEGKIAEGARSDCSNLRSRLRLKFQGRIGAEPTSVGRLLCQPFTTLHSRTQEGEK